MPSDPEPLRTSRPPKRLASKRETDAEVEADTSSPPRKKQAGAALKASATPKRGRAKRHPWTRRKKQKVEANPVATDDKDYPVWDILCETVGLDGWRYFLVDWKGVDPDTLKPYNNGWFYERNFAPVGDESGLLTGWKLKKASIADAVGPKAREKAARRTIHWYLRESGETTEEFKDSGIETIQSSETGEEISTFNEQLAYKRHSQSTLAQESPAFNSPDLTLQKFPIVKPYRRRTLSSSSSASVPRSASDSLLSGQVSDTSWSTQPPHLTKSQIETALPYASPPRDQILEIHPPGAPSHPEEYQDISASQFHSSQYSVIAGEDSGSEATNTSQVLPAGALGGSQPTKFVPDSQIPAEDSLRTPRASDQRDNNLNSLDKQARTPEVDEPTRSSEQDSISSSVNPTITNGRPKHSQSQEKEQISSGSLSARDIPQYSLDLFKSQDGIALANSIVSASSQASKADRLVLDSQAAALNSSDKTSERISPSKQSEGQSSSRRGENLVFNKQLKSASISDSLASWPKASAPIIESVDFECLSDSLKKEGSPIEAQINPRLPANSIENQYSTQDTRINSALASQVPYFPSQNRLGTHSGPSELISDQPETLCYTGRVKSATESVASSQQSSAMSEKRPRMTVEDFKRRRAALWGTSSQAGPTEEELGSTGPASTAQAPPVSTTATDARSSPLDHDIGHGNQDIFLLLSLVDQARDIYDSIFKENKVLLRQLEDHHQKGTDPGDAIIFDAARVKEKLFDVCFHTDLVGNKSSAATQFPLAADSQAVWSSAISSKCAFLRQLILSPAKVEKNIAIYAKSSEYLDILESFFIGIDAAFSRPDKNIDIRKSSQKIQPILMHTASQSSIRRVDLVIGIDESFNPEDKAVLQVRQNPLNNTTCPSICLVIRHSIEHILRASRVEGDRSTEVSDAELLLKAQKLQRIFGHECGEKSTAAALAAKLAEQILSSPADQWKLPSDFEFELSNIAISTGAVDPVNRLSTEEDQSQEGFQESLMVGSRKRSIDSTSASDRSSPKKRIRKSVEALENIERSRNKTQIEPPRPESSVSMRGDGPNTAAPLAAFTPTDRDAIFAKTTDALRADLSAKDTSLRGLEVELARLQTRFEEQSKQNHALSTKLVNAETSNSSANTRAETLKASNTALKTELSSLRASLGASDDDTTKKFAELEERAARVKTLEKQVDTTKKELEYVRQKYQEASVAGKEIAEWKDSLLEENEELKKKVSGESVKLREMLEKATTDRWEEESKKKDARISHLERALRNAQETNERLKQWKEHEERRAGMSLSTRSSSLPLQDSLAEGSAAKALHDGRAQRNLAPSSRGGTRGIVSANASRAASPALAQAGKAQPKTSPLQKTVNIGDTK